MKILDGIKSIGHGFANLVTGSGKAEKTKKIEKDVTNLANQIWEYKQANPESTSFNFSGKEIKVLEKEYSTVQKFLERKSSSSQTDYETELEPLFFDYQEALKQEITKQTGRHDFFALSTEDLEQMYNIAIRMKSGDMGTDLNPEDFNRMKKELNHRSQLNSI